MELLTLNDRNIVQYSLKLTVKIRKWLYKFKYSHLFSLTLSHYPVRSSLQSQQAAQRSGGSWRRAVRRVWGGSGRSRAFACGWLSRRSRLGTAPYSSHRKPHSLCQGHLNMLRDRQRTEAISEIPRSFNFYHMKASNIKQDKDRKLWGSTEYEINRLVWWMSLCCFQCSRLPFQRAALLLLHVFNSVDLLKPSHQSLSLNSFLHEITIDWRWLTTLLRP